MKAEFEKYLKAIDMTKAIIERVETIYAFYKEICPDEITDIFVSEYIKEDKSREYENLWFFSPTYCMEAELFATKDDFDIVPMRKRVIRWAIQKQDYDFFKSTEKSRLYVEFRLDTGLIGNLKASKENCEFLKDIMFKYVAPNLKE